MRITWVTRSYLDYRIPVYRELDRLCNHQLTLIFNEDILPKRVVDKARAVLGDRAIGLHGEQQLKGAKQDNASMANSSFRVPYQKGLVKAVRRSKPDVIISDGFFQWTFAALIVRAFNLHRIRHIMCYERTKHTERKAGRLRTLYRKFVSRWIDAIDCNGSLTGEYVRDVLKFRKPLAYGHMTAETAGVAERAAAATPAEVDAVRERYGLRGMVYLYIGQLIPRKGIIEMLRGWKRADLPDATLLLVGDGKQRKEIEEFIAREGVKNVVLAGSVNYDDLGPVHRVADCFVIPTLEDNWSLVVPEAMAAGLPVGCSIYNGCHPELVTEENGLTFDPLDPESVAGMFRSFYEARGRLGEMGEASRRIVANHTPERAAAAIFAAAESLAKKRK